MNDSEVSKDRTYYRLLRVVSKDSKSLRIFRNQFFELRMNDNDKKNKKELSSRSCRQRTEDQNQKNSIILIVNSSRHRINKCKDNKF